MENENGKRRIVYFADCKMESGKWHVRPRLVWIRPSTLKGLIQTTAGLGIVSIDSISSDTMKLYMSRISGISRLKELFWCSPFGKLFSY